MALALSTSQQALMETPAGRTGKAQLPLPLLSPAEPWMPIHHSGGHTIQCARNGAGFLAQSWCAPAVPTQLSILSLSIPHHVLVSHEKLQGPSSIMGMSQLSTFCTFLGLPKSTGGPAQGSPELIPHKMRLRPHGTFQKTQESGFSIPGLPASRRPAL